MNNGKHISSLTKINIHTVSSTFMYMYVGIHNHYIAEHGKTDNIN